MPWQFRAFFIGLTLLAVAATVFELWRANPKVAARIASIPQMQPSIYKSFLTIGTARSTEVKRR